MQRSNPNLSRSERKDAHRQSNLRYWQTEVRGRTRVAQQWVGSVHRQQHDGR